MVVTKTLLHYELLEPLGEGGMGDVIVPSIHAWAARSR